MSQILLYDDEQTRLRTAYLQSALERDLQVQNTDGLFTQANRHQFTSAIEKSPSAIFIAENIGPICHHMRDISKESINAMKNYVSGGGMVVLFGGASHYAMKEITWFWDNGTQIYKGPKETFSLVHGKMVGPHHRFPISPDDPIEHNGCFEVPILVHESSNTITVEKCWQGNCGNFVIDDNRIQHGYEILATYAQANKTHGVAAVDIPYGVHGGRFILCSVMPHYNPRHKSPLWNSILQRVEAKIARTPQQPVLKQHP